MSAYDALKIESFRSLLIGRLLVTVAVQIQGIAVGWQIYELTKNPLSLGLIGLTEAMPSLGIALYAGHLADIIDRKRLAMFSVLALVVSIGFIALSSGTISDTNILLPAIFACVAVSGFARGFYQPAIFGMVSDMVPRELYGNASAWNSSVWQASAILGPILGGILYTHFAAATTYGFASLLLMVALLGFSRIKVKTTLKPHQDSSVVEKIGEGLRFVFSNQIILGAMALDLFAVLFGGAVALLPIFASEVFHHGPQSLGLLRSAPCVGALITSSILTHRPISHNAGRWLMVCVAGFGLCMIAFGLSTNYYISLFLLALSGALDGVSVYVRSTIFQLCTPNDMKGRVAAVNSIFIGSSNEIGEFESGVTAKLFGLVPSVVLGGCMTLLVVATTAIRAPKLRDMHMYTLVDEGEPGA